MVNPCCSVVEVYNVTVTIFQSKGLPRQPSNQKHKIGGSGPRQINLSISKDIELHKAKDAWKANPADKKEAANDDDVCGLFFSD